MNRAQSRTSPEIIQEKPSFVKDTGTFKAIFLIKILSARAIERVSDLYPCS